MTKADVFISYMYYWCGKLKLPLLPVHKDNRVKGHMFTYFEDNKPVGFAYNTRYLRKWSTPLIIFGVFHEIGHIKDWSRGRLYDDGGTFDEEVAMEVAAEKYALRMLKKHHPEYVKECVEHMTRRVHARDFKKTFPMHYEAFKKLYR